MLTISLSPVPVITGQAPVGADTMSLMYLHKVSRSCWGWCPCHIHLSNVTRYVPVRACVHGIRTCRCDQIPVWAAVPCHIHLSTVTRYLFGLVSMSYSPVYCDQIPIRSGVHVIFTCPLWPDTCSGWCPCHIHLSTVTRYLLGPVSMSYSPVYCDQVPARSGVHVIFTCLLWPDTCSSWYPCHIHLSTVTRYLFGLVSMSYSPVYCD